MAQDDKDAAPASGDADEDHGYEARGRRVPSIEVRPDSAGFTVD